MAVEGIDIGWLGHFDLTNSMGIPGQFDHPNFLVAVDRLVAACRSHCKPAGVLAGSVETAEAWRRRGFRVFAYGTDISLLQQSLRAGLDRLRAGERQRLSIAAAATAVTSPCTCAYHWRRRIRRCVPAVVRSVVRTARARRAIRTGQSRSGPRTGRVSNLIVSVRAQPSS